MSGTICGHGISALPLTSLIPDGTICVCGAVRQQVEPHRQHVHDAGQTERAAVCPDRRAPSRNPLLTATSWLAYPPHHFARCDVQPGKHPALPSASTGTAHRSFCAPTSNSWSRSDYRSVRRSADAGCSMAIAIFWATP